MIRREELIEIGNYNKTHGINGEISATFDYDINIIKELDCFISEINGIYVPFFTENIRQKTNNTLLMKISDLNDDESVKKLVNHTIYAHKKHFIIPAEIDDDSDEIPLDFFIGFIIENTMKERIGKIIDVDCSTENYLFEVDYINSSVLIPANDDFIINIDFENEILTMSLPEGLLEI